jgi:hypothetical protein
MWVERSSETVSAPPSELRVARAPSLTCDIMLMWYNKYYGYSDIR